MGGLELSPATVAVTGLFIGGIGVLCIATVRGKYALPLRVGTIGVGLAIMLFADQISKFLAM